MKKRVVFAAFCILAIPLLPPPSQSDGFTNSIPLVTTALAGRTGYGGFCECGTSGCICDPGEQPANSATTPSGLLSNSHQTAAPGIDPASAAMVLALAFLLWLKLL